MCKGHKTSPRRDRIREGLIIVDLHCTVWYARNRLERPFPLGEKALIRSVELPGWRWTYDDYCTFVLGEK